MTKKQRSSKWSPTWMPFYCADYMSDERVIDLTPVGRSVYVELLCSSWSIADTLNP